MNEASIGSRVMYPPLNAQDCYQIEGDFPVSENIGEKGLWLPSYAQLSDDDIDYVSGHIIKFYS